MQSVKKSLQIDANAHSSPDTSGPTIENSQKLTDSSLVNLENLIKKYKINIKVNKKPVLIARATKEDLKELTEFNTKTQDVANIKEPKVSLSDLKKFEKLYYTEGCHICLVKDANQKIVGYTFWIIGPNSESQLPLSANEVFYGEIIVKPTLQNSVKIEKRLSEIRNEFMIENHISNAYTFVNMITNEKNFNKLINNGFELVSNEEQIMPSNSHDDGSRSLLIKKFIIKVKEADFKTGNTLDKAAFLSEISRIHKKYGDRIKTSRKTNGVYTVFIC